MQKIVTELENRFHRLTICLSPSPPYMAPSSIVFCFSPHENIYNLNTHTFVRVGRQIGRYISMHLIRCQENSTYLKSSFRSYFLAANISALLPALYRKALLRHMKHPPIFRANNPQSHSACILVNSGPNVIFGLLLRFLCT